MIVVADTTPINYLIRIGRFNVLSQLFERVIIPHSVLGELKVPSAPALNRACLESLPGNFVVRSAARVDPLIQLDAGEAEAIALAEETHAGALLMDEARGRAFAKQRGLLVIGTLGVLRMAGEASLLDFEVAVAELRRTNFFVSEKVVQEMLIRWRAGKHKP